MRRRVVAVVVGLAGLAGFVLLAVPDGGTEEVIGTILLASMLVYVVAFILLRLGPQSQPDREREARAREEFDRTGEWPAD